MRIRALCLFPLLTLGGIECFVYPQRYGVMPRSISRQRLLIRSSGDTEREVLNALSGITKQLTTLQVGQEALRNDVRDLQVGQEALRNDVRDLQVDVKGLQVDVKGLQVDVKGLQVGQGKLEKDVASIDKQIGLIVEADGRKSAEALFGSQYTKGLLAQSLQDLCYCFPDDVINSHDDFRGQYHRVSLELTTRAIKKLLEDQVPERLLRCISIKLERRDGDKLNWFQGDTKPDLNAVNRFIGVALKSDKNKALAISLQRLKYTLECEHTDRIEALQRCDGAGIMCLCAAAHQHLYLNESCVSFVVPPEILQFDMRGRIDVPDTGEYVYVDIGEVKRTLDYKKSIEQLGIRLGALGWLVTTSVPSARIRERPPDVRLVGRLFVREAGVPYGEEDRTNQMQRYVARDSWSFSLYRHTF